MDYKELPETIKTIKSHQNARERAINFCERHPHYSSDIPDIICIKLGDDYVRVDVNHLKAAIASTITTEQVKLNKLIEAHDTLEKVAKGLL